MRRDIHDRERPDRDSHDRRETMRDESRSTRQEIQRFYRHERADNDERSRDYRRGPSYGDRYENRRERSVDRDSRSRDEKDRIDSRNYRKRSPSPAPEQIEKDAKGIDVSNVDADDADAIAAAMGFGGFSTTKGQHVLGNIGGAVAKNKKTEYRQILHKKKLYEIPLTRQQAEEKLAAAPENNPTV